jgi:hypothetical protein
MKLNFATPVVGSGAGLGALCRGLGRFAECGMDQAITEAFATVPHPRADT